MAEVSNQKYRQGHEIIKRSLTAGTEISDCDCSSDVLSIDNYGSPFELLESSVTDESTGKECSPVEVVRGTTRLETLSFVVNTELTNLKRQVVTRKKMGFTYITVATEEIEMGCFDASKDPVHHKLPAQQVPSTRMANGKYQVHIKYSAENHDIVLMEETLEFCIV
jgi:hypothetical protein